VLGVLEPRDQRTTEVFEREVLDSVAEYQRASLVARLTAARAAKKARGGYAGGRPPFGYRAHGKALVPNEEQAAVVRWRAVGTLWNDLSVAGTARRPVEVDGFTVVGIKQGKIIRLWHYWDADELVQHVTEQGSAA